MSKFNPASKLPLFRTCRATAIESVPTLVTEGFGA